MKYIETLREGMHVACVYLCKNKQIALTKNGKEYGNLVLQDKTGTIDAKIWDLHSPGIGEFETMDYVHVEADITLFQNSHQMNVRRIRRAAEGEFVEADYLPVSGKDIEVMFGELLGLIDSVKNPYLHQLLAKFFCGQPGIRQGIQVPLRRKERPSRLCGRTAGAHAERYQDVRLLCVLLSPD